MDTIIVENKRELHPNTNIDIKARKVLGENLNLRNRDESQLDTLKNGKVSEKTPNIQILEKLSSPKPKLFNSFQQSIATAAPQLRTPKKVPSSQKIKEKLNKKIIENLSLRKKQELGQIKDRIRRNAENLQRVKLRNAELNRKLEEINTLAKRHKEADESSPFKLAL